MGLFKLFQCGSKNRSEEITGWSDRAMVQKPKFIKSCQDKDEECKDLYEPVNAEDIDVMELEVLLNAYQDLGDDSESSDDEEEETIVIDPSTYKFETKCESKPQVRPNEVPQLDLDVVLFK